MKEKVLTEYQFQLLNKIKDGDYLYDNHKRLEGLTTVLVELLSKDTELLYSIIDGYFGDERVINAITDYLNSQDQLEERKSVCDKHHREICRECMHNGNWTFEDTPEDTPEEWRELFAEWGLWSLVEDISDDGDGQGDNLQLTKEGREAYRMIKGLLDEREREGYEKGKDYQASLDRACYGTSFEKLENEIIDYLNTQPQEEETLKERIVNAKPHSLIPVTEGELKQLKKQDTPEEWKSRDEIADNLQAQFEYGRHGTYKDLESARKVFDKERVKEWDRTAMETYKQATQSTPEQKEEWVCPECGFDDCYPYKNSKNFGLIYCPECKKLVKLLNNK